MTLVKLYSLTSLSIQFLPERVSPEIKEIKVFISNPYFFLVCMYVCMYVCLGGAPIGFFSLLLPPVYFDELIINQVLRIIQIAVKSDVKTGRI